MLLLCMHNKTHQKWILNNKKKNFLLLLNFEVVVRSCNRLKWNRTKKINRYKFVVYPFYKKSKREYYLWGLFAMYCVCVHNWWQRSWPNSQFVFKHFIAKACLPSEEFLYVSDDNFKIYESAKNNYQNFISRNA